MLVGAGVGAFAKPGKFVACRDISCCVSIGNSSVVLMFERACTVVEMQGGALCERCREGSIVESQSMMCRCWYLGSLLSAFGDLSSSSMIFLLRDLRGVGA